MVKVVNYDKMYVVGQGSKEEGQMPSRARRRRYVAKGYLNRRRFKYRNRIHWLMPRRIPRAYTYEPEDLAPPVLISRIFVRAPQSARTLRNRYIENFSFYLLIGGFLT